MSDKPWPQEWCIGPFRPYQLEIIAAMSNPDINHNKFYPVSSTGNRWGKSRENIAYIKFCLKQNLKLIVGTSNQQRIIDELRKDFPTALFVLVGSWGVEIKIRNREELE